MNTNESCVLHSPALRMLGPREPGADRLQAVTPWKRRRRVEILGKASRLAVDQAWTVSKDRLVATR